MEAVNVDGMDPFVIKSVSMVPMVKIAVNNVVFIAMKPVAVTDLLDDVTMDVNQGGKALRAMKFVIKHCTVLTAQRIVDQIVSTLLAIT